MSAKNLSLIFSAAAMLNTVAYNTIVSAADSNNNITKEVIDVYQPKQYASNDSVDTEAIVVFADKPKGGSLINSDGISVKLGGKVNVQYGFTSQKTYFKHPSNNESLPQSEDIRPTMMPSSIGSRYTNQNALVSDGELKFTAEKVYDSCNKYGLEIVANADASAASSGNASFANKVFIYVENPAGRFELGANEGPSESMSFSATKIAKGTGGIDGDYATWIPYTVVGGEKNYMLEDTFLTTPSLPYAYQYARKANKLTYYTPTYNGFKGGLSYTPDVTTRGTTFEALSFKGSGYIHVIEYALSYDNKFDGVDVGLSFTGQFGNARPTVKLSDDKTKLNEYSLQNLGAWNIGGQVSYDSFTFAASYCDWGNSGTLKVVDLEDVPSKQANYWTAGLAYDYEDLGGLSLTYMHSTRKGAFSMKALEYINEHKESYYNSNNEYGAVSVGGEYKIMPGLMPYAEFTSFNFSTPMQESKTNSGSVVLVGLKLNF